MKNFESKWKSFINEGSSSREANKIVGGWLSDLNLKGYGGTTASTDSNNISSFADVSTESGTDVTINYGFKIDYDVEGDKMVDVKAVPYIGYTVLDDEGNDRGSESKELPPIDLSDRDLDKDFGFSKPDILKLQRYWSGLLDKAKQLI